VSIYYRDEQVTLHLGKALDVLPEIPDGSVDAVVCDPPYALINLHPNVVIDALTRWLGGDRAYVPSGRGGFMNASWDEFVPPPAAWDECLRVLKPGGHLLAFAAPRTQDLMGMSIRIAGFEIRDSIDWLFGNGFPKGQDVAKTIDRRRDDRADILTVTAWLAHARDSAGWTNQQIDALWGFDGMARHWTTQRVAATVPTLGQWDVLRSALGFDDAEILPLVNKLNERKGLLGESWAEREIIGQRATGRGTGKGTVALIGDNQDNRALTAPASEEARKWQGWNTALKPAHEPIVVARKSTGFNTTVANVLKHGTGAINVDACRIPVTDAAYASNAAGDRGHANNRTRQADFRQTAGSANDLGRWPTNVVFSHAPGCAEQCDEGCPVADLDRQTGTLTSGANPTRRSSDKFRNAYGDFAGERECTPARGANSGGASRFFPTFRYEGKAGAAERPSLADGTTHSTVKPLDLMRWLVRLVTPPDGTVLDPFAGSGTTLEACVVEGFRGIGIEQHQPFADLCVKRLSKPIQAVLDFEEAAL
jgi:DNA modification methylase